MKSSVVFIWYSQICLPCKEEYTQKKIRQNMWNAFYYSCDFSSCSICYILPHFMVKDKTEKIILIDANLHIYFCKRFFHSNQTTSLVNYGQLRLHISSSQHRNSGGLPIFQQQKKKRATCVLYRTQPFVYVNLLFFSGLLHFLILSMSLLMGERFSMR